MSSKHCAFWPILGDDMLSHWPPCGRGGKRNMQFFAPGARMSVGAEAGTAWMGAGRREMH